MATEMSIRRSSEARRVTSPTSKRKPHTISIPPTNGPISCGCGIPIRAKRPAPHCATNKNFLIPSRKNTRPTRKRTTMVAAGAFVRRILVHSIVFRSACQLLLAFVQKFLQILLPDGCIGVSAVAMRLVGDGQKNEAAILHLLDLAFGDSELRRIDEVVRRVDKHDGRSDFVEIRRWIIVSGGVYRVESVIRVRIRRDALYGVGQIFIRGVAGRQISLHHERSATGKDQKVGPDSQRAGGLSRIVAILPVRILPNAVDDHFAPNTIPPCDLYRKTRERHERVHE